MTYNEDNIKKNEMQASPNQPLENPMQQAAVVPNPETPYIGIDGRPYYDAKSLQEADQAYLERTNPYIGKDGKYYQTREELHAANDAYIDSMYGDANKKYDKTQIEDHMTTEPSSVEDGFNPVTGNYDFLSLTSFDEICLMLASNENVPASVLELLNERYDNDKVREAVQKNPVWIKYQESKKQNVEPEHTEEVSQEPDTLDVSQVDLGKFSEVTQTSSGVATPDETQTLDTPDALDLPQMDFSSPTETVPNYNAPAVPSTPIVPDTIDVPQMDFRSASETMPNFESATIPDGVTFEPVSTEQQSL